MTPVPYTHMYVRMSNGTANQIATVTGRNPAMKAIVKWREISDYEQVVEVPSLDDADLLHAIGDDAQGDMYVSVTREVIDAVEVPA